MVDWRVGGVPDHPHLRSFVCTDQSRPGTEPWAEDVEKWITEGRHLPGMNHIRDVRFHCGYLEAELVAIGTWRPYEEGYGAACWYLLPVIAVSWSQRNRGGWLADETVELLLDDIDADALTRGASEIHVLAHVHSENVPAQLMFEDAGFSRFPPDDGVKHQAWRRRWGGVPGPE